MIEDRLNRLSPEEREIVRMTAEMAQLYPKLYHNIFEKKRDFLILRLIGATTPGEYNEGVVKDIAIALRLLYDEKRNIDGVLSLDAAIKKQEELNA